MQRGCTVLVKLLMLMAFLDEARVTLAKLSLNYKCTLNVACLI